MSDAGAPAGASPRRDWVRLAIVAVVAVAALQWWTGRSGNALGREVAQAAAPGDIRMLSSTTCGICTAARLWFQRHEVAFEECFIDKDAACAAQFESLRMPGTPVILVRGRPVLGFDPQRLRDALSPS